jgi:hypothetical protein
MLQPATVRIKTSPAKTIFSIATVPFQQGNPLPVVTTLPRSLSAVAEASPPAGSALQRLMLTHNSSASMQGDA